MASTYTNDLRLELIATGEAAATWGDKTNANLTNIAAAFGYATQDGFAANADSTTTVADGAADPARAMYFKVTSSATLTATRTLTIAPNTISRVMWIENATTGGQSIQISQGTGANVTIPTGKTAVVYLDGAGSGAAVVDAMAGVSSGASDTLAEILAAGNATGGTDIAVSTGDDITFADNSKAIFGAGDLEIYHDGSNSYVKDAGTGYLILGGQDVGTSIQNSSGHNLLLTGASEVKIGYANAFKLATTSTGIDVTGTVTADGLTASGSGAVGSFDRTDANAIIELKRSGSLQGYIGASTSGDIILYNASAAQKFRAADNGDISFYEDTGTTAKFFWDASAESLGIGTSSPTGLLHLAADNAHVISKVMASTTGYDAELWLGRNDTRKAIIKAEQLSANSDHDLVFFTNAASADATEKVRITSAGDVSFANSDGIIKAIGGDVSLVQGAIGLRINDAASALSPSTASANNDASVDLGVSNIRFRNLWLSGVAYNGDGSASAPSISFGADTNTGFYRVGSDQIGFVTAGTIKAKLDASGNFLVGKSSTSGGIAGSVLASSGLTRLTASGIAVAEINRLSSDGSIVDFKKDGTTVGSIGSGTGIHFAGAACGLRMHSGGTKIFPTNGSGTSLNNTVSLGAEGARWTEVYATNGTINTSDRNEKQDIATLSDAEQRVAVACKGLLRKFRWIDAVEAKGDDARIHFGIIAQDLQAAFEAEGLEAGRYGMFINTTWTDEETEEEHTSLGVRYSELLAFIIAAI